MRCFSKARLRALQITQSPGGERKGKTKLPLRPHWRTFRKPEKPLGKISCPFLRPAALLTSPFPGPHDYLKVC